MHSLRKKNKAFVKDVFEICVCVASRTIPYAGLLRSGCGFKTSHVYGMLPGPERIGSVS